VHLLGVHEQTLLQLLDRRPVRALPAALVHGFQQAPSRARESVQLPVVAHAGHGEERRPQAPVDERDLAVEQLREQHVLVIG
jgi:hypothetical protein